MEKQSTLTSWIIVSRNIGHLYDKLSHHFDQETFESLQMTIEYEDKLIQQLNKTKANLIATINTLGEIYQISEISLIENVTKNAPLKNPHILRILRVLSYLLNEYDADYCPDDNLLIEKSLLLYAYFMQENKNQHQKKQEQYYRLLFLAKEVEKYLLSNRLKPIPIQSLNLNLYVRFGHVYHKDAYDRAQEELYQTFLDSLESNCEEMAEYPSLTHRNPRFIGDSIFLKSIIHGMNDEQIISIMQTLQYNEERMKNDRSLSRQRKYITFLEQEIQHSSKRILEMEQKKENA